MKIRVRLVTVKIKNIFNAIKQRFSSFRNHRKVAGKIKYFCIGRNKTGTTSLKKAFEDLGFIVGDQVTAEKLYDKYYVEKKVQALIKYCESAQVFQDVPFSCPDTFKYLDKAYPGSKFILTIRNDAEQWYQSLTRFHAKRFGFNGRVPTVEDLKEAIYIRKGFIYDIIKQHGTLDSDPYNKKIMTAHYDKYNNDVIAYFKDRPDDLLIINVAEGKAYKQFVKFLDITSPYNGFPWKNKT